MSTNRKIKFLDLSEADMLKSRAFQFLYNFFSFKHPHNIAVCRAIGAARIITNYDPKLGYGFTPYQELPQEGQVSQLAADGFCDIILGWIKHQRCYRYSIPSITRDTFFDLLIEDELILEKQIESKFYIPVENPKQEPVKMPLKRAEYDYDLESWVKANLANGTLTVSPCKTHLLFLPKYYKNKFIPGRLYELGANSYQTLPSRLKFLLLMPGQQNMDIPRAHITVAIEEYPEIAPAFDFPGYEKIGGLAVLNGMSLKKAQEAMPYAAMSDILNLKSACKALGKHMGTSCNKLWQYFHKREQEMIRTITDYLDKLGVGYLNMHDGLLVDQTVDYTPLGLQFGWIEKPLT